MNTQRPFRLRRDAAERLLRGESTGPATDPLAAHLAAAAAPARTHELVGEAAARAAFRAARDPEPESRRPSVLKTTLGKLLTLKVGAIVLGAMTAGGVALAAANGGPADPPVATRGPHAVATTGPVATTPAARTHPGTGSAASPSPSLVGLCRAYAAKPDHDRGKALSNPAFTALVLAADGTDKVDGYCAGVLATPPGKAQNNGSDRTPHPTGQANKPTPRTGPPTTHPAGRP